jgi:hypothetical protein
LDNINDTRNGILLNSYLHNAFGACFSAFLETPNFAMTVNDVDLARQRLNPGFMIDPSVATRRLTFQHFIHEPVTSDQIPHNADARLSDSDDWVPSVLFEVVYGCAAINAWGVRSFVKFAREQTRSIYYDDEHENGEDDNDNGNGNGKGKGNENGGGGGAAGGSGGDEIGGGSGSKDNVKTACQLRAENRAQVKASGQVARSTAKSEVPDAADMILALWMHNARKVEPQVRAMKANRTQEKVGAWLDSVE